MASWSLVWLGIKLADDQLLGIYLRALCWCHDYHHAPAKLVEVVRVPRYDQGAGNVIVDGVVV